MRRLVQDGRPDVLAALFELPTWHAARLAADQSDRVLVIVGQAPIRYRADDPESERAAWEAVTAAGRDRRGEPAR